MEDEYIVGNSPYHYDDDDFDNEKFIEKIESIQNESENKFLNVTGDSMKGILNMNKNKIINVSDPQEDNDIANAKYVKEVAAEIMKDVRPKLEYVYNAINLMNYNMRNKDSKLIGVDNKELEKIKTQLEKTKEDLESSKKLLQSYKQKSEKTETELKQTLTDLETVKTFIKQIKPNAKNIYAVEDYKNFNKKIKTNKWLTYWKSIQTKYVLYDGMKIHETENGYLNDFDELSFLFKNEFTLVIVADKEEYKIDRIKNIRSNHYHVFGWYNIYRNYFLVDGRPKGLTEVAKDSKGKPMIYPGTDLIFIRCLKMVLPNITKTFLVYNSEKHYKSVCEKNDPIKIIINARDVKFYEIMIFYRYLKNEELKEIETFMRKYYPNILYNIK